MALIDTFLSRGVKRGTLTLTDTNGTRSFGTAEPGWPDVAVRFTDAGVGRYIATHPRLGAAEAFIDGRLVLERGDIMDLLSLLRRNNRWDKGGDIKDASALSRGFGALKGRLSRLNWERKSKANVAHHYDLDERLYRLFLDADLQYSCAYYTDPANSLEQAQADKKAHIAAKLALKPGQRVLDIGCGWGGMALYLHQKTGAEVLGVTLSEEQLRVARERATAAGVADHVKFELIDYRRVQGRFDRIVSVGMFEHVGPPHYRQFFSKVHDLLTEDGVALIHTIGRMGSPGTTDAFTQKYIFPGGYIPALSEIVEASEPFRLIATDIETLRLHYALTLRAWYARTLAHQTEIEALYDARFYRMWTFYLAGAATAFEDGGLCNYQLQFARDRHALPITRDYLGEAEVRLK
ncbi:Cyclopropane-fatty-acyl-phospholipid synthase [Sphingomonas antarctica]|uniref:class I SAM-dependent methyltransferase n=1 Tax=Sphingomonas antarctica TaxID=2040274 RepID=UPI0039EA4507